MKISHCVPHRSHRIVHVLKTVVRTCFVCAYLPSLLQKRYHKENIISIKESFYQVKNHSKFKPEYGALSQKRIIIRLLTF